MAKTSFKGQDASGWRFTKRAWLELGLGSGLFVLALGLGWSAYTSWQFSVNLADAYAAYAAGGAGASASVETALSYDESAGALALAGALAVERGDATAAGESLDRAHALDPRSPAIALAAGIAPLFAPDAGEASAAAASAAAQEILDAYPGDGGAEALLGQLALNAGKFAEARRAFEASLNGSGDDGTGATLPGLGAMVVAQNGLGLTLVEEARRTHDVAKLGQALAAFESACAYRQAWPAPYANRDRCRALMVVWRCRKLGSDREQAAALVRRLRDDFPRFEVQSHRKQLETLGRAVSSPRATLSVEHLWPDRRLLFNAAGIAQGYAAAGRDLTETKTLMETAERAFEVAERPYGASKAARAGFATYNRFAGLCRVVARAPNGLTRREFVRRALKASEPVGRAAVQAGLRPAEKLAWRLNTLLLESHALPPLKALQRWMSGKRLDAIRELAEQVPNEQRPDLKWLTLLAYHVEKVRQWRGADSSALGLPEWDALVSDAAEVARHLPPRDDLAQEQQGLTTPTGARGAPRLGRRLALFEGLWLVLAYDRVLDAVEKSAARAVRRADAAARTALKALRLTLVATRLRFSVWLEDSKLVLPPNVRKRTRPATLRVRWRELSGR